MALTTPSAATDATAPPLIVGPLSIDLLDGARLAGGAVSYAARAAEALGGTLRILTVAGPEAGDDDTAALEGHEVELVRAEATLTLEHEFDAAGRRSMRVVAAPGRSLSADDLPDAWREGPPPSVVMLAPLLPGDVEVASFASIAPREAIALLGQGMQREQGSDGALTNADGPTGELLAACEVVGTLFLSEDETASWPSGALEGVAALLPTTVITRGADGADVLRAGGRCHIEAAAAESVDTTGAGDVFATTYMIGVRSGVSRPGRLAAELAAAATELVGPKPLPSRHEIAIAPGRPNARGERGPER